MGRGAVTIHLRSSASDTFQRIRMCAVAMARAAMRIIVVAALDGMGQSVIMKFRHTHALGWIHWIPVRVVETVSVWSKIHAVARQSGSEFRIQNVVRRRRLCSVMIFLVTHLVFVVDMEGANKKKKDTDMDVMDMENATVMVSVIIVTCCRGWENVNADMGGMASTVIFRRNP